MYTDGQVIFRTNVEGSREETPFLELQTQGLENMFHIIHRPEHTTIPSKEQRLIYLE